MSSVIGIDWGAARSGLAIATLKAKLPEPLETVKTGELLKRLKALCQEHDVETVVVGLPRSLDGNETAQTARVRRFAAELAQTLEVETVLQDEAGTSQEAMARLSRRGRYDRKQIDAEAAAILLEDYLNSL